jgi:hypothetical protein
MVCLAQTLVFGMIGIKFTLMVTGLCGVWELITGDDASRCATVLA